MKKYILYILPLLLTLIACNDLNKYPKDSVNSETFFQNASQLDQYSVQFYSLFPTAADLYNEKSDQIAITELSDEVRGTRIIPTDASGTQWNWTMLRHINYLLEHINQCSDPLARDEYRGLAYFFRAYFYAEKIKYYGDVPWIDKTLGNNEAQTYAKRDSRSVVMQNIIQDLDSAFLLLHYDKSNVYRVNCWAAMALKSRVCLYEGTFCKYHPELPFNGVIDREAYWHYMLTQAYEAAKTVMVMGGYNIYKGTSPETAYRELFTQGKVQGMDEYILARSYNQLLKMTHNLNTFTTSPTLGRPGFTKRLVNQYLMIDGTPYTKQSGWDQNCIGPEMIDRDPRMEQTMIRPGYYIRTGEKTIADYNILTSATGYQLIKYVMPSSGQADFNSSDCDMPLIRYAEVLLNYAEAKAELGEKGDDISDAINQIRDRVAMPHLSVSDANDSPCSYMQSLYPNVDKGENMGLILEIRRERSVELVQEGFRYWDLMRWKEGKAFEQPYLGVTFPGVSKNEYDEAGFVDFDGDYVDDACAYINSAPFAVGIQYLEVGKKMILHRDSLGGCILSNGQPDADGSHPEKLIDGRSWNENRDYLYPVPIRERILSEGKIYQNPGWDDGLGY